MKSFIFTLFVCTGLSIAGKSQTYNAVSTFAGTSISGLADGSLANARFNGPYGICMDNATNTIYVADALNHAVRKISNGTVSTLAGNGTMGDVDGQGTNARFYSPSGICFSAGFVYITDNGNNKIKRIDSLGNVVTIAGTGTAGYQDGSALQSKFNNPVNLIADNNGNILVADYGNNCIRHIINGQVVNYAGAPGAGGDQLGSAGTAKFNRPTGLAMDASGNLYVSDQVNGKIKLVSGGNVTLVAGSGSNSSIDGTGASASFYRPTYMDFDLSGNILVVEWITNKIRRVTPAGVVTTIAGTGSSGYIDGSTSVATFNVPYGVCVDDNGEAYIGDKTNNVIRKISISDVNVPEIYSSVELSVYPNPVADQITLVIPENFGLKNILVYDVRGAVCKTIHAENQSGQVQISVADLAPGQYFLIAEGEKENGKATIIRE